MNGLHCIYRLILAVIVTVFPLHCAGETFDVRAGDIVAGAVPLDPEVTQLTLRGSVNAADLHYIALNCRLLQSLDLGAVTVEAYSGDKAVATNRCEFPAGVLPAYALSGLAAKNVVLPAGITGIADGAMLSAALEELTVSAGVTSIGVGAFADCRSLRKVTLGPSVVLIGARAFSGCPLLAEVAGGEAVAEIGEAAFSTCPKLTGFASMPALTAIGDEAFASSGLRRLDLSGSKSLGSVGARAFAGCTDLEEIFLPDGLTELGEGAFFGAASLRGFVLPKGLTALPALALTDASGIDDTSGLLHNGVKTIGAYSLAGMEAATAIELPASLLRIDDGAFEGWTSLGSVMAEALSAVPALGEEVWAGVDQANAVLTVADGMEADFKAAEQWKEFRIKKAGESGIELITGPDGTSAGLKARFERSVLELRAAEPIAAVAVHDVDGRLLYEASGKDACELTLSTGLASGRIYIVSLRMTAGQLIGLKIINR